jgi:hypothetical protein
MLGVWDKPRSDEGLVAQPTGEPLNLHDLLASESSSRKRFRK